jgi:hypothetical protein
MDCFSLADPLGPERKVGRGWNKSPYPTPLTIMKCEICGTVHEKYQAHKFASNTEHLTLHLTDLVRVPDPTKAWELTESDKRLLISSPDRWVMVVLNDVAARQSNAGPESPTTPTNAST